MYSKLKFLAVAVLSLSSIYSCSSDDDFMYSENGIEEETLPLGFLPPMEVPDSIFLSYGEEFRTNLPEGYSAADVSLQLDFSQNDLELNDEYNLKDILAEGIMIDSSANNLYIDSEKLYPNNFSSSTTGIRLPEAYSIALTASSSLGYQPVTKRFSVKITPAIINIDGLDNAQDIPFAYKMYGEEPATYHLLAPGLNLEDTQWNLHQNGRPDGQVSLEGDIVKFQETAGDPDQEAEWTYDLIPSLERNGYTLARRQFRVRFIPQIKFLYGMYYPDLDLTILTNYLHIGLGNAFRSQPPSLYPEEYKGTFSITAIKKDGEAFEDAESIFSVNPETGVVEVVQNTSLLPGAYEIAVKTITTTNMEFEAKLTLEMHSSAEE